MVSRWCIGSLKWLSIQGVIIVVFSNPCHEVCFQENMNAPLRRAAEKKNAMIRYRLAP